MIQLQDNKDNWLDQEKDIWDLYLIYQKEKQENIYSFNSTKQKKSIFEYQQASKERQDQEQVKQSVVIKQQLIKGSNYHSSKNEQLNTKYIQNQLEYKQENNWENLQRFTSVQLENIRVQNLKWNLIKRKNEVLNFKQKLWQKDKVINKLIFKGENINKEQKWVQEIKEEILKEFSQNQQQILSQQNKPKVRSIQQDKIIHQVSRLLQEDKIEPEVIKVQSNNKITLNNQRSLTQYQFFGSTQDWFKQVQSNKEKTNDFQQEKISNKIKSKQQRHFIKEFHLVKQDIKDNEKSIQKIINQNKEKISQKENNHGKILRDSVIASNLKQIKNKKQNQEIISQNNSKQNHQIKILNNSKRKIHHLNNFQNLSQKLNKNDTIFQSQKKTKFIINKKQKKQYHPFQTHYKNQPKKTPLLNTKNNQKQQKNYQLIFSQMNNINHKPFNSTVERNKPLQNKQQNHSESKQNLSLEIKP